MFEYTIKDLETAKAKLEQLNGTGTQGKTLISTALRYIWRWMSLSAYRSSSKSAAICPGPHKSSWSTHWTKPFQTPGTSKSWSTAASAMSGGGYLSSGTLGWSPVGGYRVELVQGYDGVNAAGVR